MSKKQPSSDRTKKTFKKEEHSGQKGFKKFFKGDNEKSSRFKEDGPVKKGQGERKSYKKSNDNGDDSSRGVFRRDEKTDKKSGSERKSFKRSFDQDRESSQGAFRRDDNQKRGEKSFKERGGYKRASDQGDRPYRKEEKPFSRKNDRQQDKNNRPNRYAHVFGKLDDEELAAHQQKLKLKKEEREQGDEVSFSKSLEKWEDNNNHQHISKEPKADGKRKTSEEKPQRHNKKDKFRRNFDYEQDYEKAYAAKADGRIRKKKVVEQEEDEDEEDIAFKPAEGKMPLNKYIAHCDICSRRDAVALIKDGKVKVNGTVVTEPGYKVSQGEEITLNDKKLSVQKNLVYILMNKPKGYITTTDDPKGRKTVMDIVGDYIEERVFPIGRLDRNTTGLLLLTNDGELAQKLSHPKYEIRKVYQVKLDKAVAKSDFDKIAAGITLEDGPVKVDAIEYLDSKDEIGLEIHSGKNRIVRRIFESLGYEVEKLDRVMYAGLTKKNILRGKWRFLSKQEVINLKHFK